MARPRDRSKRRWTSRRYTIGFIEDYRESGTCYARIGDWRKSLSPLKFHEANRSAAVAILDELIRTEAYKVPPSWSTIRSDGSVHVTRPEAGAPVTVFELARSYHARKVGDGVSKDWTSVFRCALKALIGEKRHEDQVLNGRDLTHYIEDRLLASSLSPKTKVVYTSILRPMFEEARKRGTIDLNPIDAIGKLKEEERVIDLYTPEEEFAILQSARRTNPELADFLKLCRMTALRRKEAWSITLSDIDWKGGVVHIDGKGGRARMLPLRSAPTSTPLGAWLHFLFWHVYELAKSAEMDHRQKLFTYPEPDAPGRGLVAVRQSLGHVMPDGRRIHTFRKMALTDWRSVLHLPEETITAWAGNTERIRRRHYYEPEGPRDVANVVDRLLDGS